MCDVSSSCEWPRSGRALQPRAVLILVECFLVCVQYESVRVCVLSERYGRMCSVMEWQLTTGGLPGVELAACGEIVERRTDHGHGETVCGAVFRIRSNNKKRLPVQNTRAQHTKHAPPLRHLRRRRRT